MSNVQDQTEQARVLERQERYPEALRIYDTLLAEQGPHREDPGLWLHLADLQQRTGAADRSLASYEEAIELFVRRSHHNNAIALCRRALRQHPSAPTLALRLGELASGEGYPRDARDGYIRYAELRASQGDTAEATRALRELARRHPSERDEVSARLTELGASLADEELPSLATSDETPPTDDLALLAPMPEPDDASSDLATGLEPGFEPTTLHAGPEPDTVAPLEGLEPTHAEVDWGGTPAPEESHGDADDVDPLPGLDAGEPFAPEEPAAGREVEDEDPLPLLGFDSDAGWDTVSPADPLPTPDADELPLLAGVEREAEPEPEPEPLAELRPADDAPGDDFVDLGALILSDQEEPGEPRFFMDAAEPSGDEDRDLDQILSTFRQKVNEQIDPGDASSHYDLGLAFKEMGLLDDAIAQLQLALRGGANPLATLEVLGECFLDRGEPGLAAQLLTRATQLPGADEADLVAVLYLLGRCNEATARPGEAVACYQRVVAVDIAFRDAAARLATLRSDGSGAL